MNIQMSKYERSGTGNGRKIDTPENWRKFFLLVCGIALAIDPLFLFIPDIDYKKSCIGFDEKLRTTACAFRFFIDALYVIHIIRSFPPRTRSEMSGGKRFFYFIVDIVSILPIPQVMVFYLVRNVRSYLLVSKRMLKWTIVAQYIPRIIRIIPIYKEVTKTTVTIAGSKWIGALLNLLLFLLCSYVFGAFWYVTAVGKLSKCWYEVLNKTMSDFGNESSFNGRNETSPKAEIYVSLFYVLLTKMPRSSWSEALHVHLYCAHLGDISNSPILKNSCPIIDSDKIIKPSEITGGLIKETQYDFGMYGDVVDSGVGSINQKDFPKKFFYCFWWGLRNLSTFAENLKPGNSATDIFFAIIICASGLFLVAVLIGNVQKYLLSSTIRADEMQERKKDTETWMTFRQLPEELKKRIKENEKTMWKNMRGTDEESLLRRFPEDLRRDIQPFLDEHGG